MAYPDPLDPYSPNNLDPYTEIYKAILYSAAAVILGFFALIAFSIFSLPSTAFGQTLTRNGNIVTIAQGNGFSMKFYGLYGGAPLSWYNNNVLVTEDFGGEGVQIVYDTGQDGTQSTGTGLDYYPISQLGRPETYKFSYFGYEEIASVTNGKAVYQTTSFLPYFWVSLEAIDDVIPTNPTNWQNRWSLEYNDILGLGKPGYETFGVPIYFAGVPARPSGIILIGDEIKGIYAPQTPWPERINKIPSGRFALRIRISMQNAANDAIAGLLLRKNLVGATSMDAVFDAKGDHLNINRQGVVQLIHNGVLVWTAPWQYWAAHKTALSSADGLEVEIRTHNWDSRSMYLYFNGVMEGIVASNIEGESFGLLGIGASGYTKFFNRQFVDVGTKCTSRWETTPQGTILATLSVYRVASPMTIPMYRLNLPVAFVKSTLRQTHFVWNQAWSPLSGPQISALFPAGWVPYVAPNWQARAFWSGTTDGKYGVFIKPKLPLPINGQMVIAPSVQAHTTLPYSANISPPMFGSSQMSVEVAPQIRWDLLHD